MFSDLDEGHALFGVHFENAFEEGIKFVFLVKVSGGGHGVYKLLGLFYHACSF